MNLCGVHTTKEQITGTLTLLRHLRAFLKSDATHMPNVQDPPYFERIWDKAEAQQHLWFLIDSAINRKARLEPGWLPNGKRASVPRKLTHEYQIGLMRDCWRVRDYYQYRIRPGINRFETDIIQRHYGHLLESED